MNADSNTGILIKIFMGCPLTAEIKMRLQQSREWQHVRTASKEHERLTQAHFQGKDYLGRFLSLPSPTTSDLRKEEKVIYSLLNTYCPDLETPPQPLVVFPQLFLS